MKVYGSKRHAANDFMADVYNVLADVVFEYYEAGIEISESQMQTTLEYFLDKFYSEDIEDKMD